MKESIQKLLAAAAIAALLAGCSGIGPLTNNGTPYPEIYILGDD